VPSEQAKLKSVKVSLSLPFVGNLEGTWEADQSQQQAAWEMYVELVSRISVQPLSPQQGLIREALSSLYSIFGATTEILRKYGPVVAQLQGASSFSFGYVALTILNKVLRPFLSKWHPLLLEHEEKRGIGVSIAVHERRWEKYQEVNKELEELLEGMTNYAGLLAEIADVPHIADQ
jgi:hypothetical protein